MHGRAPADLNGSLRIPDFLAGCLVVGHERRVVPVVLVALDDHEVPVQHWRRAGAEPESREGRRRLPGEVALGVKGVEAFGTEVGVDHGAVGHRGRPGEAAAPMARVEDGSFVGRPVPEDLAGGGVEGEHLKGVLLVGGNAVGVDPVELLSLLVLDGPLTGHDVALEHGGQVDTVAPDNRRGHPRPGQLSLPGDVLVGRPLGRRLGIGRHALPARPTPLRPVLGCHRHRQPGKNGHNWQQANQGTNVTHRGAPAVQDRR